MARSVDTIQQQIIAAKQAQPELAPLNSDSKRAIWNLWTYVVASCIAIFEQILDVFISDNETHLQQAAAGSNLWIQSKMFAFQYSSTSPQIVQLINNVPTYPVIDTTLRIITACAIKSDVTSFLDIKVAKSNPFQKLEMAELSSAQSYINTIGIAGLVYNVISLDPDQIMVQADIYYKGQYSALIQNSVTTAINNFLQTQSLTNFDGAIKMSDLEGVIRGVDGVNDVYMRNVRCRSAASSYFAGIDLIINGQVISRQYNSVAGYLIPETTATHTFEDTLNYISQ